MKKILSITILTSIIICLSYSQVFADNNLDHIQTNLEKLQEQINKSDKSKDNEIKLKELEKEIDFINKRFSNQYQLLENKYQFLQEKYNHLFNLFVVFILGGGISAISIMRNVREIKKNLKNDLVKYCKEKVMKELSLLTDLEINKIQNFCLEKDEEEKLKKETKIAVLSLNGERTSYFVELRKSFEKMELFYIDEISSDYEELEDFEVLILDGAGKDYKEIDHIFERFIDLDNDCYYLYYGINRSKFYGKSKKINCANSILTIHNNLMSVLVNKKYLENKEDCCG